MAYCQQTRPPPDLARQRTPFHGIIFRGVATSPVVQRPLTGTAKDGAAYAQIYAWLRVEPPRGVLLHGPPGCGKTALANAIANECGVPFLRVSAPEIVSGMSGMLMNHPASRLYLHAHVK